MKNLLKLEELTQFLACLGLLISLETPWWTYVLLVLGPDISMLGYLVNTRVGAFCYNIFHHKGLALLVIATGGLSTYLMMITSSPERFEDIVLLIGIILYGHASMDRIFGYGLKFGDSFHHTHLGWIGQRKEQVQ